MPVPFCPPECHLDGACPPKCHCAGGVRPCGSGFCPAHQTCCVGQPFPDHGCIDGDICPISRRKYKTETAPAKA